MAINPNDYKERIRDILSDDDIDGVRSITIGAPYLDKLESARDGTLYITTNSTRIDSIRPVGTVNDGRIESFEHELRLHLLYVTTQSDGQQAEIAADNVATRIADIIEGNARLSHGSDPIICEYAHIETIDAGEFGKNKTARILGVKIIVNN